MQNFRDLDVSWRDLTVGAATSAAVATAPSLARAQQAATPLPAMRVSFTASGKARELTLDKPLNRLPDVG